MVLAIASFQLTVHCNRDPSSFVGCTGHWAVSLKVRASQLLCTMNYWTQLMLGYDKYLALVDVVYLDFQKAYNLICNYNLGPQFLLPDKRKKRLERV